MYTTSPRRRTPRWLAFFLIFLAVAVATYTGLRLGPSPTITFEPELPGVGVSTAVVVRVEEPTRGISSLHIVAEQGTAPDGVEVALADQEHLPRPSWAPWRDADSSAEARVLLGTEHQPALRSGTVTLRVKTARAGTWLLPEKPVEQTFELPVRLDPPSLQLISETPVVRQGGAGAVAYRVDPRAVRHGVRVGQLEITGYPLPGTTDGESFALYGVPWDVDDASQVVLFAVDELGNHSELSFLSRFDRKTFKHDQINLSDGFLGEVVPEILQHTPEIRSSGNVLQDYLRLNGELRQANAESLRQLAASSRPERLWHGPFEQLPSSRVMATFGDRRTYLYDGKPVDEQSHLGHDLASVRQAPVPASNSGVVMRAGYFGIYGNTVVLDHGYGLLSLYSHLSRIDVKEGEAVKKGQTLGRTGATGMAGGDHLHFTVMVGGVMVDPLEWWDRHWLETRLHAPLGDSFAVGG